MKPPRDLVVEANAKRPFPAMAHLTCVSHSVADLTELLADYSSHGVSNLLALAGDPPADGAIVGDLKYRRRSWWSSFGPRATSASAWRPSPNCITAQPIAKRIDGSSPQKLNMADFGVTDFFFTASDYVQMVNELADLGCDSHSPGIMPVTNPASIKRFAEMSKIAAPKDVGTPRIPARRSGCAAQRHDRLYSVRTDRTTSEPAGCPGVHIYALNKPEASMAICEQLACPADGRSLEFESGRPVQPSWMNRRPKRALGPALCRAQRRQRHCEADRCCDADP